MATNLQDGHIPSIHVKMFGPPTLIVDGDPFEWQEQPKVIYWFLLTHAPITFSATLTALQERSTGMNAFLPEINGFSDEHILAAFSKGMNNPTGKNIDDIASISLDDMLRFLTIGLGHPLKLIRRMGMKAQLGEQRSVKINYLNSLVKVTRNDLHTYNQRWAETANSTNLEELIDVAKLQTGPYLEGYNAPFAVKMRKYQNWKQVMLLNRMTKMAQTRGNFELADSFFNQSQELIVKFGTAESYSLV